MVTKPASDMASRLAALMRERLRVRGSGLEAGVARAGRLLPARVRRAALEVAEAARREAHPRLARLNDPAALARACAEVEQHLKSVDPRKRRKDAVLGFLGSVSLGLLALFAAVVTVLLWRGLL